MNLLTDKIDWTPEQRTIAAIWGQWELGDSAWGHQLLGLLGAWSVSGETSLQKFLQHHMGIDADTARELLTQNAPRP